MVLVRFAVSGGGNVFKTKSLVRKAQDRAPKRLQRAEQLTGEEREGGTWRIRFGSRQDWGSSSVPRNTEPERQVVVTMDKMV